MASNIWRSSARSVIRKGTKERKRKREKKGRSVHFDILFISPIVTVSLDGSTTKAHYRYVFAILREREREREKGGILRMLIILESKIVNWNMKDIE